jgi:hypothetical protein
MCESRPGSGQLRQGLLDSSRPSRSCPARSVGRLFFLFVIVTAFYPAAFADCTIQVQGSLPEQTFTTQQSVTATAMCDGGFATVDWGDSSGFISGPSPLVVNHTYSTAVPPPPPPPQPPPPLYFVQVSNGEEKPAGAYFAFQTKPATPSATFAGGESEVVATIGVTAPPPPFGPEPPPGPPSAFTIHFECDTVVDSDGTVYTAAQASNTLHLDCHATPNVNVAYLPNEQQQPVKVGVATSGPPLMFGTVWFPSREICAACTITPFVLLLTVRVRRRQAKLRSFLAACVSLGLSLTLVSCGGGFSLPAQTKATPPGQYQVNVISVANGTPPTGFVQTTLIVPLTVSETQ